MNENNYLDYPQPRKEGTMRVNLTYIGRSVPDPIIDDEILDWDCHLDPPPPFRSGTIKVRLFYAGRSKTSANK